MASQLRTEVAPPHSQRRAARPLRWQRGFSQLEVARHVLSRLMLVLYRVRLDTRPTGCAVALLHFCCQNLPRVDVARCQHRVYQVTQRLGWTSVLTKRP
jgi:hypothetical protein